MDAPPGGGRDSRFNLGYNMSLLSGETAPEMYGSTGHNRPSTSISSGVSRSSLSLASSCGAGFQRGIKRTSEVYLDQEVSGGRQGMSSHSSMGMTSDCGSDIGDDTYPETQKKTPPPNGKKTKGRVKIKMEYIDNKLRRYTTFSKRKTGIMKKSQRSLVRFPELPDFNCEVVGLEQGQLSLAYELSTLTGTQVMLLVASETGHVYTFATRKLQPMITSEAGKALIQTCLNSPDPPPTGVGGDQRMSATGFEETELTYNIGDEEQKVRQMAYGVPSHHAVPQHPHSSHPHPLTHTHHYQQHPGPGSPHQHVMGPPPPSHLIPCSSPGPMMGGGYQQSPSPLPPHAGYPPPHPHMSHSHPQR
uniref:Serum response factor homolog n=1 Tax=Timema shepardi TaxID=629360 RepID=A0A7R9FZ12_TIMSH|nr:unnamed protein product [Timema shepardi]